jgi:hypothetical protein
MANSFSISWCNFKWTMELFFHLLDLTVLYSWILLHLRFQTPCGEEFDWRMYILYNQWDASHTVFFIIISTLHVSGGFIRSL